MAKKNEKPKPPSYFSSSQVDEYLRCPRRYEYKYIKRIKAPYSLAATFGIATHRALESNFSQKIISREDMKIRKVKEVFVFNMEEAKDRIQWKDEGTTLGEQLDVGSNLLDTYFPTHSKRVIPIKVEHEFKVNINGISKPFVGILDLMDTDFRIIDFKTANKTPSGPLLEKYYRQLASYAFGTIMIKDDPNHFTARERKKINSMRSIPTRLEFLIKTKVPKVVMHDDFIVDLRSMKRFKSILLQVDKSIQAGVFPPNLDSFMCTPKYCPYWDICHVDLDDELDKAAKAAKRGKK